MFSHMAISAQNNGLSYLSLKSTLTKLYPG
jgi:lambda repressor-like predicted transcriptional regulator